MPNKVAQIESVAFHITAACSHTCPYCYMADVKAERPAHPPLEQLLKIVDALKAAQVKEINFVGGDPAMYPKIEELARYAYERGLTLSVLSNTHRYPGSSVAAMAKYVAVFETTFHAASAASHDAFCHCPGAFDYVVERLREAASMGRKIGIVLNVIPQTVDLLFEMARVLKDEKGLPLSYALYQRIIPFGRALSKTEFRIDKDNIERALNQIERIDRELGIDVIVEDPFPLCVVPERARKYIHPCQWGLTKVAVNDKGDLSRCGADPRGSLGSILETPLLEIWHNAPSLIEFRVKNYLPESCRVCPDFALCGGGCPLSGTNDGACGQDCLMGNT